MIPDTASINWQPFDGGKIFTCRCGAEYVAEAETEGPCRACFLVGQLNAVRDQLPDVESYRSITADTIENLVDLLKCGGPIAEMTEQEYSARFGPSAAQPPPAPAPAQQPGRRQQAQPDGDAPICGRCKVNPVGRRRDGRGYFDSCF
jgi:hypothetical protein